VGEWVGFDVAEHLAAGGVAVGTCTQYDHGHVGVNVAMTSRSHAAKGPPRDCLSIMLLVLFWRGCSSIRRASCGR